MSYFFFIIRSFCKIRFSATLLFLALISSPVFSESRNALLIANAAYSNYSSLATPIKEAKDLKKTLETLGFSVVILENASLEKMQDELYNFGEKLKKSGGVAFFHYGGHAVQVNGINYLIPANAEIPDERRIKTRALDVDDIMQNMHGDTNIVILDACRNNPLAGAGGRSASRGLVLTIEKPLNSIIVYSAQPNTVAQDGVFTPILTKKLLEQKELSIILRDVRREVFEKTNGAQVPGNYEQLMTNVYLAGHADPVSPAPSAKGNVSSPLAGRPMPQTFIWEAEKYIEDDLVIGPPGSKPFGVPTPCGQVLVGATVYRVKSSQDGKDYFILSPKAATTDAIKDPEAGVSFVVPKGERKISIYVKADDKKSSATLCFSTSNTDISKIFKTSTVYNDGEIHTITAKAFFPDDTVIYIFSQKAKQTHKIKLKKIQVK